MTVSFFTEVATIIQRVNDDAKERMQRIERARARGPVLVQPRMDLAPLKLPLNTAGNSARMVNFSV